MTTGKSRAELTQIADDALRSQPGCETASVPAVRGLPNIREGRNWEIPNVVLGDSLISDVDRAVMSVHRRLGRKYHLLAAPATRVEFKISLVRPITPETGEVKAEGKVLSCGRRVGTAEGRVVDGKGRLLAHGTTTCLIFSN